MEIASWNVNSLKSRLPHVITWLKANEPDVLFLQELKGLEFPSAAFEGIGYQTAHIAQKTYNGVATVSPHPIEVVSTTLAGDETDSHARYLETKIAGLRLINIYVPNGNPVGNEKFQYKLEWMGRLRSRLVALREKSMPAIVGGDFNVIPEDIDCFSPEYWKNDALFQPEPRAWFRSLRDLGYVDAFRHFDQEAGQYTFWEYIRDMFRKNQGIRIDHFLVSTLLKHRMISCRIDKIPRGLEKPSDHTPIILAID
jgi:exodeoxyribonuclease III